MFSLAFHSEAFHLPVVVSLAIASISPVQLPALKEASTTMSPRSVEVVAAGAEPKNTAPLTLFMMVRKTFINSSLFVAR